MIKIMNATRTLPNLVSDNTNGLGRIDPISCLVTEELNGVYEADITMLATDKHFSDLSVGGILKIPVNEDGDEQLFRIYYISRPLNEKVEVRCQHISYDLSKVAVRPFTATGSSQAVSRMVSNMLGNYPFTMTTDILNTTSKFTLDIPRTFRECLGGYEGSLLDVFRGEYEFDNLEVKMLSSRGQDNGVRIAYGKNLTDFQQEENIESVYTSVLGYATVDGQTYTGDVYHKVSVTYPKVKIVDFTEDYTNDSGQTTSVPTTEGLTTKAQQYADRNSIEVPKVSISVSFVPLYQTEEYKDIAPLEKVSLGDTVHVYFDKLGVEASSRVVKTVWNANLNRYDSVELGSTKSNLNTVLNDVTEQVTVQTTQGKNFVEEQLNQMASLIINGLGLHRTLVETEGGGYRIYLHNKETLEQSDTQYIFTAEGFLVSTDYGQTWNAGFDSQGNAVVNSLSTIVLRALEIYGAYIEGTTMLFGDPNGDNISVYPRTGGVAFTGSGTITFNPTGQFLITNRNDSDDIINQYRMYQTSTTSNTELINYYTSGVRANEIDAYTSGNTNSSLALRNYTNTGNLASTIYNDWSSSIYQSTITVNGMNSTSEGATIRASAQSGGNWIELKVYDSSHNQKAMIQLDSSTGNINITGKAVYFNGTKKW